MIGRAVFEPCWRGAASVQALVKTKSREAQHLKYHVAGAPHILMDDGTEIDRTAGDVSLPPSGMRPGRSATSRPW